MTTNTQNQILVIGDVHRKIDQYKAIIDQHRDEGFEGISIQVGDFGFAQEHQWYCDNMNTSGVGRDYINFGNHDDYNFLFKSPYNLGHSTYFKERSLMTVRGAYSIDKSSRIHGVDWFKEEELDYTQSNDAIYFFELHKPSIMVTHDCPHSVREKLFHIRHRTLTSDLLQAMLEIHQPDLWIFGHHHKSRDEVINGTRFICLAELECMII